MRLPTHCTLCPRRCGANRSAQEVGYCGADHTLKVARSAQHFWEEPFLCSPTRGSGTVFFSGCALRCSFCQNHAISTAMHGKEISVSRLAEIFFELESGGAANINLVTPDHYALQVTEALRLWKNQGGALPVVLNTGSYMLPATLSLFEGLVDIFLPDFKYITPSLAKELSNAPDYPEIAKAAIAQMVSMAEPFAMTEDGAFLKSGVCVRHLLLPGHVKEACAVTKYLFDTYGNRIYLSLMNQFTPIQSVPGLSRAVTKREYNRLLDYALSLGIENCMIQEFGTAKESFIPLFDETGV